MSARLSKSKSCTTLTSCFSKREFVALIGPSGSGKSTLLNIIGLLDRPTRGRLFIEGHDTSKLDDAEITKLRGHSVGFVFQYHYLISAFTALENVMMPMLVDHEVPSEPIRARAEELLAEVGLTGMAKSPRQQHVRRSTAACCYCTRTRNEPGLDSRR